MDSSRFTTTAALVCTLTLAACASNPGGVSQRPLLYPNPQLSKVGQAQADADVDACMTAADEAGAQGGAGGKVAERALEGGAARGVGAAAGAAVRGGDIGMAAGAGAAAGAASGAVRGAFRASRADPAFKGYVNACLKEKGYRVAGWK
jgi:hypothetical protein